MFLHWLKQKSNLFHFTSNPLPTKPSNTWVVGDVSSPTFSYYFDTRHDVFTGYQPIDTKDLANNHHPFWLGDHDLVILFRDVPVHILKKLTALQQRNRSIVWFIDDDIPSIHQDNDLPNNYRKFLHRWYKRASPYLSQLCSDVWVSTHYLAEQYHLPDSSIYPPIQLTLKKQEIIQCCYHGASSHQLEWDFVIKFVKKIQAIYTNTHFELIGSHELNKACREIPRVSILHPMRWNNYQSYVDNHPIDIALSPLFDSPFNYARSYTRLLEITRQGAVGIYSPLYPYADRIQQHRAGFIAENNLNTWATTFNDVIEADRPAIVNNAQNLIATM